MTVTIDVSETADPLSAAIGEAITSGKSLGWEWPKYPSGAASDFGDAIIEYTAGKLDRTQLLRKLQDIFASYGKQR